MEPITGLNNSGGTNRLRFAKLDQRIAQARSRVDVVHKVSLLVGSSLTLVPS